MSAFTLRPCGSRGFTVPALGLGGATIGRGPADDSEVDESAVRTIEAAHAAGLTHIDTSPAYGQSERRIGIALRSRELPGMTISTKVGTHPSRRSGYAAQDITWSLRNSLTVLGRDSVDLALVHDPPAIEPVFARGDGFDALHALREQGLCRNVGLGVRDLSFHRMAIEREAVDVILTYGDLNIVSRRGAGVIALARDRGVGVLLGSPMMHGLLATERPPGEVVAKQPRLRRFYSDEDLRTASSWYDWCREREVSLRHLNMQYLLRGGLVDCVLTGAGNPGELSENVRFAVTPLPDGIWREALERVAMLDDGGT